SSLFSALPHPPRSTLFPYTTLFRSQRLPCLSPSRELLRGDVQLEPALRDVELDEIAVAHESERASCRGLGRRVQDDGAVRGAERSEEHTSELQSPYDLVCRLLLEKK